MQTFKDPILTLKKPLLDMDDKELAHYIRQLGINRLKGPKPVKRSKETGAPSKSRAANPATKLEKLLASMPKEERDAFIESLKEQQDGTTRD